MSELQAAYVTGNPNAAPIRDASIAAISYALKCGTSDGGMEFLHAWNEGNFKAIRNEWPDAPEAVFIGADPLHPLTPKTSRAIGNVVIMGDRVFAGIDRDDQSTCSNALVIEFESLSDLRAAIKEGCADFTVLA